MIKAIILEDERNAQQALENMLQLVAPDVQIVRKFTTVEHTLAYVNQHDIDLAFLDIEVEDGNSFELFETFQKIRFEVIFTTAFNQFAVQAFKVNAIDYLLKPINPDELADAVAKVKNQLKNKELKEQFSEKIILKTATGNIMLPIHSIIRLEADGAYTVFITETRKIVVSKSIKHYEALLPNEAFIRCHQSHLVSMAKIRTLQSESIQLINGEEVPVSHRKKAEIRKLLL